jgi:hypothetical protein
LSGSGGGTTSGSSASTSNSKSLITFIGSTHTVTVTEYAATTPASGAYDADKLEHLQHEKSFQHHSHPLSHAQSLPSTPHDSRDSELSHAHNGSNNTKTDRPKKDVQSLLTFAAGLFGTPPNVVPQQIGTRHARLSLDADGLKGCCLESWDKMREDPELIAAWRKGLAPCVRARLWQHAIGNELQLTEEDFNRCLAISHMVASSPSLETSGLGP